MNTYNLFNQLTATNINGSSSAYTYNTAGIRTAKTVDGVATVFLLDGGNVVGEVQSGEVTATYLRGANLLSTSTDDETSYYLLNAHGDVTALTSGAQTVTKTYDYDAFGNEKEPSATDANPFRYCGEYFDKETGTYYLRARYYDPSLGRFTQQDTHWNTANMIYGDNPNKINEREDALGLKTYTYAPSIGSIMQSGNLYVYCINNPITYADNTGRFFNCIVGALVGGLGEAIFKSMDSSSTDKDIFASFCGGFVSGFIGGLAIDFLTYFGGSAIAVLTIAGVIGALVGTGLEIGISGKTCTDDELIESLLFGGIGGLLSGTLLSKVEGLIDILPSQKEALVAFFKDGFGDFGASLIEEVLSYSSAEIVELIYKVLKENTAIVMEEI